MPEVGKFGHARIGEDGKIWGQKGDQTGNEVAITDSYNKEWDFYAIYPDADVREKHAKAVEAACKNDKVGYNQYERNTLYQEAVKVNFDLSKVPLCNTDCSSLQHVCAIASGVNIPYGSNGMYTAIEEKTLAANGYKILKDKKYMLDPAYYVRGGIFGKASDHTVCTLTTGSKYQETLEAAGVDELVPYNEEYKGEWKATAKLNVRADAGVGNVVIDVIDTGEIVNADGYYKDISGRVWLHVSTQDKKTGYASTLYLKQVSKPADEWTESGCRYKKKDGKLIVEIDIK